MIYAGTILEINNNKTYVFTMDYSVVTIKTKKEYFPGQQITFSKKDKYIDLYLLGSGAMKAFALAAAAILLVAAAIFVSLLRSGGNRFDEVCTALVSVDINPSIEISVNKDDRIVSAAAVNEDGRKVLEALDLRQKALIDGVNAIVSAAQSMGYIDDSQKVVLVSAALYASVQGADARDYAVQLKDILSRLENSTSEATVLTVFIEDSAIINQAKNNNLSIGKELLYQYAVAQDGTLTADDIRTASLNELLDKLALATDGQLEVAIADPANTSSTTSADTSSVSSDTAVATTPTSAPDTGITATPTALPDVLPTSTPIPEATKEPVPEPTKVPDPTPTPLPVTVTDIPDNFSPDLTVTAQGDSIQFCWTPLDADTVTYKDKSYQGFLYYKVVASADNPHPIYPDDGYLAVISERWQDGWSVTPSDSDYNCSPELLSGATYYFSITYVFDNGKFTSDTETLKVPEYDLPQTEEIIGDLTLTVSSRDGALLFHWTPLNSSSASYQGRTYSDFNFYKVVASRTNPNPVYPDDGYLTYVSDCYADSWSLAPAYEDYNHSPELIPGETYYFSITYVFGNGKLSTNTVSYTVP